MANCLSRRDQKFIWFFKIVPLGALKSFIQKISRRKGVFIEVGLLPTLITNSFENLFKNLETFLFIIFIIFLTLWSWNLFPSLEISAKFVMTKGVQNKFIHFMQMLTSKQCLYFLKNIFTNENIHNKTARSWSFILMLLVSVDKSSEFG